VAKNWGGPFSASYEKSWRKVMAKYKRKGFSICHMSMYGLPIQTNVKKVRKRRNVLVVIGAEKVPGEVYRLADYNIAITNQPHSEVAALAVFLHEFSRGKELGKKFAKAKLKIIPQERGKKVVSKP
jgi:tRNA (cytidine56-2'-O)-methyltransferase